MLLEKEAEKLMKKTDLKVFIKIFEINVNALIREDIKYRIGDLENNEIKDLIRMLKKKYAR